MNSKVFALAAAALVAVGSAAKAQIVPGAIALPDSIVGTYNCTADNVYQMVNTVKVGPGSVLRIEPGTIIYGNKNGVRSCLQIERNGKIYAPGTPSAPIIFTSSKPQGQKAPGDWGGILLLGNATINSAGGTATIEGGTNGTYGGANDADSSGVMTYVRIEYGGLAFSVDNEINGLTFGGVGNRTVVNHIQVSYNNDDSYEFFGGTVNTHHLIALATIDDDFDTDNGYRGRGQFFFALRDSLWSDLSPSSSSEGFEADNDATGSANAPLSRPILSNYTMVGPYRDTATAEWGQDFVRGGRLRRNTLYGIFNTVISGWQTAFAVDGNGTASDGLGLDDYIKGANACPAPADFRIRNTAVTGKRAQSEIRGTGATAQADADAWFNCSGLGNQRVGNHSDMQLRAVNQNNLNDPDPRPLPTSPAATGTDYSDALLAAANNFSFTSVGYKGAFDPSTARDAQWDKPWSNYNPQQTSYVKHKAGWNLVSLANTPSSASKDAVFKHNSSNAFRYNNGYTIDNTLDAGVGYWVLLSDNSTVEQTGTAVALPRTISVQPGWNLISSGASVPALVSAITASGTQVVSNYFGFDNGYYTATRIEPGRAYWVNVTTAGTLTIN